MANTYLTAKNSGFQGSFSEWVSQGRPEGVMGNSGEKLPVLRWRDNNGQWETIDPNNFLQNKVDSLLADKSPLDGIGTVLSRFIFPPDIYKNNRAEVQQGTPFDYDRFEDPELAKKILPSIERQASKFGSEFTNLSAKTRGGSVTPQEGQKLLDNLKSRISTEGESIVKQATQSGDVKKTTDRNQEAPYGFNQRTGEPLTETQAFMEAKQSNPNLLFSDFQDQVKSGQFQDDRDPLLRGDRGTIQEQNKTGLSFSDWKKQNPQGSYQDWLNATGPSTSDGGTTTGVTNGDTTGTGGNLANALKIINDSDLSPELKSLFSQTVKNWDPNKEINMENVLSEFKNIRENTIDPFFKEQSLQFENDLIDQIKLVDQNRAMELEAERTAAGNNIRQAKEGLEASGMTFTGKGVQKLGAESAFAQENDPNSPVPAQTPFGGLFHEGSVNQSNRLMASSSALRNKERIDQLSRAAERTLGSQGLSRLGISGVNPKGDITSGSLEQQKYGQYANVLSGLAGQNRQVNDASEPFKFSFTK